MKKLFSILLIAAPIIAMETDEDDFKDVRRRSDMKQAINALNQEKLLPYLTSQGTKNWALCQVISVEAQKKKGTAMSEWLIAQGAQIDNEKDFSQSPLWEALHANSLMHVQLLLEKGANTKPKGSFGGIIRIIDLAKRKHCFIDIITLLKNHGALDLFEFE